MARTAVLRPSSPLERKVEAPEGACTDEEYVRWLEAEHERLKRVNEDLRGRSESDCPSYIASVSRPGSRGLVEVEGFGQAMITQMNSHMDAMEHSHFGEIHRSPGRRRLTIELVMV